MLVKASIVATALIAATVGLSSVDYHQLYNEMYPVNGLQRGVLGLCHEAKPSFVRALRSDRENCYDSMPDSVELAIGWIRTSSLLAAINKTPTAIELAERILAEAALQHRIGAPTPLFTGYVTTPAGTRPCPEAKGFAPIAAGKDLKTPSDDRFARRVAGSDDAALVALGLAPRAANPGVVRNQEMPVLQLNGTAPPTVGATTNPQSAAIGCKTPA